MIDEAANVRGLIGEMEARAFAMLKKEGLEIELITQSLLFDDDVAESLLQNATRIICYAVSSPETARKVAEIIGTMTLDAMKVHHTETRKRQRHAGYRQVKNYESDGYFNESQYQEVAETKQHYLGLNDQKQLKEQDLMQMKPRERWVVEDGTARKETVPFMEKAWVYESLGRERVEAAIAVILSRPEYHEPSIEMSKQKEKKRGNSGMRKSKKGSQSTRAE